MYKEDFLHYLSSERAYSEATVKEYDYILSDFAEFVENQLGKKIDWGSIQDTDIREWIISQMNNGSAASSVNTRMSALRSFYKFLLSREYIKSDPTQKVECPKRKKALPYYIREGEMERLFDDLVFPDTIEGMRDYMVMLTFYSTGVRLAELIGLNVEDVDFGTNAIKVTGKRNKQRLIPFGEEMRNRLTDYIQRCHGDSKAPGCPLFVGNNGKRITRSMVRTIVEKYLGLVTTQKKRSPHVLRHSFATAMLNNGANIEVVKELLGHESLATTEIYTHVTFEELKKVYNQAHPRA